MVIKTTGLHEKTVQTAASNTNLLPKRTPTRRGRSRNSKVVLTKWSDGVDPLIVFYVKIMRIRPSRIEVRSPKEIVIHNPS